MSTYSELIAEKQPSLRKKALAVKVGDQLLDLFREAPNGETGDGYKVVTFDTDEGKMLFWHSSAHILAQAVRRIWPDAKFDDGPALMSGPGHFYYDIYLEHKISEEDFARIEAEVEKIVSENHTISRRVLAKSDALAHFQSQAEQFKVAIIEKLPESAEISLYSQGDFEDLCRGPHVPSTGVFGAFKLTAISGAYWKGDASNPMLQRIYGVSFPDNKMLKSYIQRLEEAKKRDHRKLGKELELFHIEPTTPGMVYWHPKGYTIYTELQSYIRRKLALRNYQELHTPTIADKTLWEKSGHWEVFRENMFFTESEEKIFAVKPMNCPCHVTVFNQGLKSYRDLPLRLAEFGSCHRNEPSGTLHGLMRVRAFTQDDAHIFCTEEQIQEEVANFIDLVREVYTDFGFNDILVKLSTRPEKRVGTDENWDRAEKALEVALDTKKLDWELNPGEGAFYGPKIEFSLRDCLDRVWQCGTIQVDFSMPGRLGAEYVASDGSRKTPVMLHRAVFGSLERFIGILIEEYAGKFPVWLSPIQVSILSVNEEVNDYSKEIEKLLKENGFRVELNISSDKIGYKIREWTQKKINYAVVLGAREKDGRELAVRERGEQETKSFQIQEFIDLLKSQLK
ncbi:MAG: threonine--tRNA ligase [Leptospiraceae bacterium]|nr:threonine--tRNA ligase [Leptospiraceae bacterium]